MGETLREFMIRQNYLPRRAAPEQKELPISTPDKARPIPRRLRAHAAPSRVEPAPAKGRVVRSSGREMLRGSPSKL